MADNPELKAGYREFFCVWSISVAIPWLVMGAGILCGWVRSTAAYLDPWNGPFVVLWYLVLIAHITIQFYWLFFRGGAEILEKYPGLVSAPAVGPLKGSTVYCLVILAVGGWALVLVIATVISGFR